jgi:threonine synthase
MEEINHLPRLACVQAENCSPIAGAFLNGLDKISPYTASKPTIASGINDPLLGYEDDGEYTLARIRDTGGTAVSLSEKEIEESVLILAKEGIYAEPAGAAGMMGTLKLADDGTIKRDETVVMVVTGHGLKNPLPLKVPLPPVIASSEELTAFVRLSEQKGS